MEGVARGPPWSQYVLSLQLGSDVKDGDLHV
jgi:hypothetical protein